MSDRIPINNKIEELKNKYYKLLEKSRTEKLSENEVYELCMLKITLISTYGTSISKKKGLL